MNTVSSPPVAACPRAEAIPAAAGRLASLDALRGFDMVWIVGAGLLVRLMAEITDSAFLGFLGVQLTHVDWEGLRFFDLIYPLFLFLVGISLVFSLDRSLERDGLEASLVRIVRRTVLLFALNFLYNGGFSTRWPDIRVSSGVLAMIAASYFLAAILYCCLRRKLKTLVAVTVALLLGNWALMEWVAFPDFRLNEPTIEALAAKAGSHDPAAVAAQVPTRVRGTYEPGYNLSNYLDYRLLPGKLMKRYYENQGILSPLASVTLCLAGILAGRLLKNGAVAPRRKVVWLAAGGIAAAAVGWLWSIELPVIKRIWTSSYCLITAGYSAVLMAVFYQVVDVWKFQAWCRPLLWIGVNPITIYLLHEFIRFPALAGRLVGGDVRAAFDSIAPGLGAAVIEAVALGLVLLLARFLYRRQIFLKI